MTNQQGAPEALTDFERRHAIRQGYEIAASDGYFEARPQIDSHGCRKVFQAGFERGWDRHAALVEAQQPAPSAAAFDEHGFRDWVLRNLPKGSIIGNGEWWADHLTARAKRFVKAAPQPSPTPQADSQPAPVADWLPFSKRTQIADRHGVKVTAEFNALVRDVIQTYLETHADRAASAPAPSGHIKEPYTVAEIKAKIASNDYSAELLLQHAMLHLDRLAASDGSVPVAADGWLHENGLLYRLTDERHPRNRDEINVTMADGSRSIESRSRRALELLDRIRATHPSPPEGMVGGWIASKDQMPPPGVRVFWGDVDSNRVGYDFWAGDDYRWTPSHWMHIPEFPAPPTTSAGSGKGE